MRGPTFGESVSLHPNGARIQKGSTRSTLANILINYSHWDGLLKSPSFFPAETRQTDCHPKETRLAVQGSIGLSLSLPSLSVWRRGIS